MHTHITGSYLSNIIRVINVGCSRSQLRLSPHPVCHSFKRNIRNNAPTGIFPHFPHYFCCDRPTFSVRSMFMSLRFSLPYVQYDSMLKGMNSPEFESGSKIKITKFLLNRHVSHIISSTSNARYDIITVCTKAIIF